MPRKVTVHDCGSKLLDDDIHHLLLLPWLKIIRPANLHQTANDGATNWKCPISKHVLQKFKSIVQPGRTEVHRTNSTSLAEDLDPFLEQQPPNGDL